MVLYYNIKLYYFYGLPSNQKKKIIVKFL